MTSDPVGATAMLETAATRPVVTRFVAALDSKDCYS